MSHAAASPVLVIHGGAGVIKRDTMPAKERAAIYGDEDDGTVGAAGG